MKLEQSGRQSQVYLGEQGTGCLSHYVNCLVSESDSEMNHNILKGEVY